MHIKGKTYQYTTSNGLNEPSLIRTETNVSVSRQAVPLPIAIISILANKKEKQENYYMSETKKKSTEQQKLVG